MMVERFLNDRVELYCGDCRNVLATLAENSLDACVTDPPYGLQFMGREWDKLWRNSTEADAAYVERTAGELTSRARKLPDYNATNPQQMQCWHEAWAREVYRVLKPGAHLIAMGGTRTYHRLACAIEDAGFEIRDTVSWLYGSGFPKSHDVSKGIDRAAGAERDVIGDISTAKGGWLKSGESRGQKESIKSRYTGILYGEAATPAAREWAGWGTALKPAMELCVLARKPLSEGAVAANVLRWGTGAINVEGCRVRGEPTLRMRTGNDFGLVNDDGWKPTPGVNGSEVGRWPANVVLSDDDEVVAAFPETASGLYKAGSTPKGERSIYGQDAAAGDTTQADTYGDSGSASRFFFQAKQDDPCRSINSASDAVENFALKSEHVVSVLSHAVAITTERLALEPASYRAPDMNVSVQQFALIVASVTETIQNIERRFSLGLPLESITARLGHAICVAIPNQIGITTITASLSTFDPSAEAVTFNIIETSAEVGAQGFAKRFHYTSKADADDRLGSKHPTVKPVDLMQWLVRLVTPRGGTVLDPFAGTGTTGEAAWREGMRAVLIEREPEYQEDCRRRMKLAQSGPDERQRESIKARNLPRDEGPLFAHVARETWAQMWQRSFDFAQEPKS